MERIFYLTDQKNLVKRRREIIKLLKSSALIVVFLLMHVGTTFAQTKGTVMLPELNIGDSQNVDVSITVSTDSSIGIA